MRCVLTLLSVVLVPVVAAGQTAPSSRSTMTHNQFSDWVFNHNAGWKAIALKKYDKAEFCFKKAIELGRIELDTDPRLMARSYADLAWLFHLQGRDADAEPLARWALLVREKAFGAETGPVAETMYTLASIELKLGHIDEAETLLTRTLNVHRKLDGSDSVATTDAINDLATVFKDRRKYDKARALFGESLAIIKERNPDDTGQVVPLDGLATIEIAEGKWSEAEVHLDRLQTLTGNRSRFSPGFAARILTLKAEVYRKTGRADQAAKADEQARVLLDTPRTTGPGIRGRPGAKVDQRRHGPETIAVFRHVRAILAEPASPP